MRLGSRRLGSWRWTRSERLFYYFSRRVKRHHRGGHSNHPCAGRSVALRRPFNACSPAEAGLQGLGAMSPSAVNTACGPRRVTGLLELLLTAGGRVVSSEELLERVWDENADPFTQSVKVSVSRLRAKLGDPPVIETVPQGGYRV
jgi:hypothetical protein